MLVGMLGASAALALLLAAAPGARGGPPADLRSQLKAEAAAAAASVAAVAASAAVDAATSALASASAPPGVAVTRPVAPHPPAEAASAAAPPYEPVDIRLAHPTVVLPAGRVGEPWGPLAAVRGGVAPYVFGVKGRTPPGLQGPDPDGVLAGTPTLAGHYDFTLTVRDASSPPRLAEQRYLMQVRARRGGGGTPAPERVDLGASEARSQAGRESAQAFSYLLAMDTWQELFEPAAAEPGEVPADPTLEPPALPDAAEIMAGELTNLRGRMLRPLVGQEFPTRALFAAALLHRRDLAFQALTRDAPPRQCAADPKLRPTGDGKVRSDELFCQLLPAGLATDLIERATVPHDVNDPVDLRLEGGGCGCSTPLDRDEVYGLLPFWQGAASAPDAASAPQGPASAPVQVVLPVNFENLHRISFLGAVLDGSGHYQVPTDWDKMSTALARETRRHGVALDLTIYGRGSESWLQWPRQELRARAARAAAEAVRLADAPFADTGWRDHLMQWLWGEHLHQYDGLTLFFDEMPSADPKAADKAVFQDFLGAYLDGVVRAMQASGRPYRLNLVIPQSELSDTGRFPYAMLLDLLHAAETGRRARSVKADEQSKPYRGTTDILVSFLVVVPEPTRSTKHELRKGFDDTRAAEGSQRIALLDSVVAVNVLAAQRGASLGTPERSGLAADLAYAQWNFGGSGFFPLPVAGARGDDDAMAALRQAYQFPERGSDALCRIVCPHRGPLRLLLQSLALLVAAGTGAYLLHCRVRQFGRRVLIGLWAGAVLALLLGGALLTCDPALAELRAGNRLLYALIVLLCTAGLYYTFKPRVDPP